MDITYIRMSQIDNCDKQWHQKSREYRLYFFVPLRGCDSHWFGYKSHENFVDWWWQIYRDLSRSGECKIELTSMSLGIPTNAPGVQGLSLKFQIQKVEIRKYKSTRMFCGIILEMHFCEAVNGWLMGPWHFFIESKSLSLLKPQMPTNPHFI